VSSFLPFRRLIYAGTFLTGATGLVFQVVWQKYLSYLVGSESRSSSLVVAVFLLGLASGYRFWGKITEKRRDRRNLLKIYGYLELSIGAFAIIFPQLFALIRSLSYASPDHFGVDFALTMLALFVPTFLMGATIPLLTTVVPEDLSEISSCHARIYGVNTLGAFLGCFLGGFFLVPRLGLSMTLLAGGMVNLCVALVFIGNQLSGRAQRSTEVDVIEHRLGRGAILLFVFIIGAVSISFEILFMRLLGLSIGSGHYVFPVVVGVYVLGLALGSLTLRGRRLSLNFLFRELVLLVVTLGVVYATVPYWPYWLSLLRFKVAPLPSGYGLYLLAVSLFLAVMTLPFLVPMGRLLPLGYALIGKDSRNYGRVCGEVYFTNTLGTVAGAVFLSHLLLHFLDIDQIFRLNILLLAALTCLLLMRQGRRGHALLALVAAGAVFMLPAWDRSAHHLGLFRMHRRADIPARGVFQVPKLYRGEKVFFGDGPNSTVSVLERSNPDGRTKEATFVVNGKSDGDTEIDYSTMSLAAVLPYLYGPERYDLSATVVGLGTGVTAGVLGRAVEVKKVVVLEISPLAIAAQPYFDDYNGSLSGNGKVTIEETDAFRYFARERERADLIVAEPSTAWVVGVENLFTPEFYSLVNRNMTDDGVFLQWMNIGENTEEIFLSILDNVTSAFTHLELYHISAGDVAIVASRSPLRLKERRFSEGAVREVRERIRIRDRDLLRLLQVCDGDRLRWLAAGNTLGIHDFDTPRIGLAAGKAMFHGSFVHVENMIRRGAARHLFEPGPREKSLLLSLERYRDGLPGCEDAGAGNAVLCSRFSRLSRLHRARLNGSLTYRQRLEAYGTLREEGFLGPEKGFLEEAAEAILGRGPDQGEFGERDLFTLLREYGREGEWEEAATILGSAGATGIITPGKVRGLEKVLQADRKKQSRILSAWRSFDGRPR
jgi:spermidine synthase